MIPGRLLAALAVVLLALPAAGRAQGFLQPPSDLAAILPPPPAPGDGRARDDLDVIRALTAVQSATSTGVATRDADDSVFLFADVLGPGFTAAALPHVAALFARVDADRIAAIGLYTRDRHRPRPGAVDPTLHTCLPTPNTDGYPSMTATAGLLDAILLGDMVPDRRAALFERARAHAVAAEVCGLAFPSDTEAGFLAATALATALRLDAEYLRVAAEAAKEMAKGK